MILKVRSESGNTSKIELNDPPVSLDKLLEDLQPQAVEVQLEIQRVFDVKPASNFDQNASMLENFFKVDFRKPFVYNDKLTVLFSRLSMEHRIDLVTQKLLKFYHGNFEIDVKRALLVYLVRDHLGFFRSICRQFLRQNQPEIVIEILKIILEVWNSGESPNLHMVILLSCLDVVKTLGQHLNSGIHSIKFVDVLVQATYKTTQSALDCFHILVNLDRLFQESIDWRVYCQTHFRSIDLLFDEFVSGINPAEEPDHWKMQLIKKLVLQLLDLSSSIETFDLELCKKVLKFLVQLKTFLQKSSSRFDAWLKELSEHTSLEVIFNIGLHLEIVQGDYTNVFFYAIIEEANYLLQNREKFCKVFANLCLVRRLNGREFELESLVAYKLEQIFGSLLFENIPSPDVYVENTPGKWSLRIIELASMDREFFKPLLEMTVQAEIKHKWSVELNQSLKKFQHSCLVK